MKTIRHLPLSMEPVQVVELPGKWPGFLGIGRTHRGAPLLVVVVDPSLPVEPHRLRMYSSADEERLEVPERSDFVGLFQRGGAVHKVFHELPM